MLAGAASLLFLYLIPIQGPCLCKPATFSSPLVPSYFAGEKRCQFHSCPQFVSQLGMLSTHELGVLTVWANISKTKDHSQMPWSNASRIVKREKGAQDNGRKKEVGKFLIVEGFKPSYLFTLPFSPQPGDSLLSLCWFPTLCGVQAGVLSACHNAPCFEQANSSVLFSYKEWTNGGTWVAQ